MKALGRMFFCAVLAVLCAGAGFSAEKKSSAQKKERDSRIKVVELVNDEGAFQTRSVDRQMGNVRVFLKGSLGSFQFYTVNSEGLSVPVLANYDDCTSSFFSVLAGKKEYRLTDNAGVIIGTRKSCAGAQIVYVVPHTLRLFVKFDAMKSIEKEGEDVIKVTAVLKNRGKRTETFALKNVLDTVFGEQRGPHFSTAEHVAINSEMQFRKFDRIKWIKSESSRAGMQVILHGADVTPPEVVSLANKDLLSLNSWIPQVVRSRKFDSLLSYNNSALCINWEPERLAPDEEATFVYYMAFSSDGLRPRGEDFVSRIEKEIRENSVEKKYSVKQFEDAYQKASALADSGDFESAMQVVLSLWEKPEHRNGRLESLKAYVEGGLDSATAETFEKRIEALNLGGVQDADSVLHGTSGGVLTDSGFAEGISHPSESSEIPSEKMNYNYVQDLIDRIYSLENSDGIDREEIIRLNAELDSIMNVLRD